MPFLTPNQQRQSTEGSPSPVNSVKTLLQPGKKSPSDLTISSSTTEGNDDSPITVKTLNVCVPFILQISRAKQNHEIKGHENRYRTNFNWHRYFKPAIGVSLKHQMHMGASNVRRMVDFT